MGHGKKSWAPICHARPCLPLSPSPSTGTLATAATQYRRQCDGDDEDEEDDEEEESGRIDDGDGDGGVGSRPGTSDADAGTPSDVDAVQRPGTTSAGSSLLLLRLAFGLCAAGKTGLAMAMAMAMRSTECRPCAEAARHGFGGVAGGPRRRLRGMPANDFGAKWEEPPAPHGACSVCTLEHRMVWRPLVHSSPGHLARWRKRLSLSYFPRQSSPFCQLLSHTAFLHPFVHSLLLHLRPGFSIASLLHRPVREEISHSFVTHPHAHVCFCQTSPRSSFLCPGALVHSLVHTLAYLPVDALVPRQTSFSSKRQTSSPRKHQLRSAHWHRGRPYYCNLLILLVSFPWAEGGRGN